MHGGDIYKRGFMLLNNLTSPRLHPHLHPHLDPYRHHNLSLTIILIMMMVLVNHNKVHHFRQDPALLRGTES